MKKAVAILAALLLLLLSSASFAEKAGDTVTVPIYISTTNACYAKLSVSGNGWCDVLSVTSSYGQASGTQLNAQVNPVIPSGQVGTATIQITTNVAGTYRLSVSVVENWTYDEDFGDATAYSGSVTVEAAPHTHTWGAGVVTTPATCTEDGVVTYTCTDETCGETTTTVDPAKGHSYDNGVETTQPTCTEEGVKTFTCTACGDSYTDAIDAKGHAEVTVEGTAATCTEAGKTEGKKCTVCGTFTVPQEEIPASGHTEETIEGTAATCTEAGKTDGKKCTVCGVTIVEQTEIPAKGHTEVVDAAVAATCTTDGKTEGKHCSVCNEVLVAQETVPATGHTEEILPAVAADCKTKTDGKTEGKKCSVCGEIIVAQETVPYQHTPAADAVVVEPTCTEDGSITGTCSVCGDVLEQEIVPATGHAWDNGVVTTAPTCEAEGVKTYTCANDAAHTKTETVAATGHSWDDGVVTTAPTCEAEGVKTYTCANDAAHTKTEAVATTGHAWDEGVITTEPTCTEAGEKLYTCANDSTHTKTETVKALGHTWGEWVVTKPATDDEDGEKERTCSVCGEVETGVISANVYLHMNVCALGIRFRDLETPVSDDWFMFTPIDLSVEGEQTFDLIAGNAHVIGTVTVTVAEGNVTITYELVNERYIDLVEEFMTILPSIADVTEVDVEEMTGYAFGEPISIQDTLGGDTKVLLFICNKVIYEKDTWGIKWFDADSEAYEAYVEELKQLMD